MSRLVAVELNRDLVVVHSAVVVELVVELDRELVVVVELVAKLVDELVVELVVELVDELGKLNPVLCGIVAECMGSMVCVDDIDASMLSDTVQ